jgi:hypothetical protein
LVGCVADFCGSVGDSVFAWAISSLITGSLKGTFSSAGDGSGNGTETCGDLISYTGSAGILDSNFCSSSSGPVNNMGRKITAKEIRTIAPTRRCFNKISTLFLEFFLNVLRQMP